VRADISVFGGGSIAAGSLCTFRCIGRCEVGYGGGYIDNGPQAICVWWDDGTIDAWEGDPIDPAYCGPTAWFYVTKPGNLRLAKKGGGSDG
jgi:hypothetical protein